MIVIAEFYAKYSSSVIESELESAGQRVLEFAENVAREHYAERYKEFGITIVVRVETGSTRVWVTVKAVGKAFLLYAAIRQGTDYLVKDTQDLARLVIPGIATSLGIPDQRPQYHERRLGLPGQLRRLFERVQRGELSPEEATNQAIVMFQRQDQDALREIPDLKERLSLEFRSLTQALARRREQQHLFEASETIERGAGPRNTQSLPQRREQAIATLPGTAFRRRRKGVIVIRDSETGSIRVTPY